MPCSCSSTCGGWYRNFVRFLLRVHQRQSTFYCLAVLSFVISISSFICLKVVTPERPLEFVLLLIMGAAALFVMFLSLQSIRFDRFAIRDSVTSFWRRITSSARAPTLDRMAEFERQSTDSVRVRRHSSLQARRGSVSSTMQDSESSEQSPSNNSPSLTETVSQTSRNADTTSEVTATETEREPKNEQSGQMCQDTPLLHRKEDKKADEQPSSSVALPQRKVTDSVDKSYSTFEHSV